MPDADLARRIDRHRGTVGRELRRNRDVFGNWHYQPAHDRASERRSACAMRPVTDDADLPSTAPKDNGNDGKVGITAKAAVAFDHDPRMPLPGAFLTRRYKGREIVVKVRPKVFEHEGGVYRSLSAVSKAVTGKHWNGYPFGHLRFNSSILLHVLHVLPDQAVEGLVSMRCDSMPLTNMPHDASVRPAYVVHFVQNHLGGLAKLSKWEMSGKE